MNFNSKLIDEMASYAYGIQPLKQDIIKLNTNENPYPPSNLITDFLKQFDYQLLSKYCDPTCIRLKEALAHKFNVSSDNVFVGNGSDDVLFHLYHAFLDHGDVIAYPSISYGFYEVYAQLFSINSLKIPLQEDFSIDLNDYEVAAKVILIANPNAPTSLVIKAQRIKEFIINNPDKLIIIDEAYIDFSQESCVSLIKEFDNLIVVQTLSKSSSLAGLRVGYCLGNSNLIKTIEKVKNCLNPYNVDTIAQAIACISVNDYKYQQDIINKIITTRHYFSEALKELGFIVLDSHTNFVFTTHPQFSGSYLYEKLLAEEIYVRHFPSELLNPYLRITIGTQPQMEQVIKVLSTIIMEEL
ncbi:MAG: histidinol-phosphate transaminase [Bacilli bacterium]